MKKNFFVTLITVFLVAGLIGSAAIAGPSGPAGKSNTGHLYLYKTCPALIGDLPPDHPPTNLHFCNPGGVGLSFPIPPLYDQNMDPVGRAWGKLEYNVSGPVFEFAFNGHHLTPGTNYTLIYFPENFGGRFGSGLIYWVLTLQRETEKSISRLINHR